MTENKIIGFDAKRIVRNGTGLGGYGRTLVNDLIRRNGGEMELLLYAPDMGRDHLRQQIIQDPHARFVYPKGNPCRLSRDLWRVKGIVSQLKADGVQLFHGLTGELPLGIKKSGIKTVVTIHDLIFMRHPEYYNWLDVKIYEWKFRQTLKEADRIIAISECTKRDIIELGGISGDNIDVIYQSCNPRFLASQPSTLNAQRSTLNAHPSSLPPRYMLCVGTIEERKNLMLALRSLVHLPEDIHLVAVGKQTKYAALVEAEAEKLGLKSRLHMLSGVSDADLHAIYSLAEVFVYPSRYEGFGIPIIEAIFSGLPVVACTGSCLEEAGGPDCLYVHPDDVDGFAQCVCRMLIGSPERDARIRLSQNYVQRFCGQDVASQVAGIYNQIL
jgi:glycosyltransferase involved in cell wall biosynthesis